MGVVSRFVSSWRIAGLSLTYNRCPAPRAGGRGDALPASTPTLDFLGAPGISYGLSYGVAQQGDGVGRSPAFLAPSAAGQPLPPEGGLIMS